jgi:arsenate reductase (thioredoxin)
MARTRVLFLCTQNSARSQMAEAFLRERGGDRFEAYSAGCAATGEVHPYTVQVMDEVGIDIGDQYPKGMREYMGRMHFGYVITVCARAERECPTVFPGAGLKLSWLFDDPRGPEVLGEEQLEKFREVREVRDRIEAKILHWIEHPEEEIERLEAERERERQERMRVARIELEGRNAFVASGSGISDVSEVGSVSLAYSTLE